jgi:hypothetical protein
VIQLFMALDSSFEVEASIVDPVTLKVFSPTSRGFVDAAEDAWIPLLRFEAPTLAGLRVASVDVPELPEAQRERHLIVFRFAGTTEFVGEPVPLARFGRPKAGYWGGWHW